MLRRAASLNAMRMEEWPVCGSPSARKGWCGSAADMAGGPGRRRYAPDPLRLPLIHSETRASVRKTAHALRGLRRAPLPRRCPFRQRQSANRARSAAQPFCTGCCTAVQHVPCQGRRALRPTGTQQRVRISGRSVRAGGIGRVTITRDVRPAKEDARRPNAPVSSEPLTYSPR
jgi:hypothetical protein